MTRRDFAFWISFGMFTVAEKLGIAGLDRLAAATLRAAEPPVESTATSAASATPATPAHWRSADNATWRWYERENFVDGQWKLTGITTPIHKQTGDRYTGHPGYLDDNLIPSDMRLNDPEFNTEPVVDGPDVDASDVPPESLEGHHADAVRRARHGRPPSHWLRGLHAKELRIWLKTIDPPEAGVEGMTYWEHLTRDHFFDADKIAGLTISEQAKLHAAAHFGY